MKSFTTKPETNRPKLGNLLILAVTAASLLLLSLLKSHYCPAPYGVAPPRSPRPSSKLQESVAITEDDSDFQVDEDDEPAAGRPVCYESSPRSDTCDAAGDVRVQPGSKTIFLLSPSSESTLQKEFKISPYTRKSETAALAHVRPWTLLPAGSGHGEPPQCTKNFTSAAVVFSIGGFTGNLFHDFTDVLVPLFITARKFHGDVRLIVADTKAWWVPRFRPILDQLTNYDILDADGGDLAGEVLCFPRVVAGLEFQAELGVDDTMPGSNDASMAEFKAVLRAAFGLERETAGGRKKRRLLMISRKKSRAFVNEAAIAAMASSLGFDVRVVEPNASTDVARFARLVNSADVMLGVHGAGLTNMVYLPARAVVVQVVPFGALNWLAKSTFELPATAMGLNYLKYEVVEEESTLLEMYPREHEVISNPAAVHRRGWNTMFKIYLKEQNFKVQLGRMRKTLLEALKMVAQNKRP